MKETRVEEGNLVYKVITYSNGVVYWYHQKNLHREIGPAFIVPGDKVEYLQHGEYHRVDEPAIIYEDGYSLWYLNGNLIYSDKTTLKHKELLTKKMMRSIIKYGLSR